MKITFSSFQQKIEDLRAKRIGALQVGDRKLSVVILGAGPAGLVRAIQSVLSGHKTEVIEMRPKEGGRLNTIALNRDSISILQGYGVYQWLSERKLIFSHSEDGRAYLSVRLRDLEGAMRAVLRELGSESTIRYGAKVQMIDSVKPKTSLWLGNEEKIRDIDLIVNAEGARSTTNALVGISREEILPKVPAVVAFFEDDRPSIDGIRSFFNYLGKSLLGSTMSIYYYAIFFFRFIVLKERFANEGRSIAEALILTTPRQNYLSFGLTEKKAEQMMALQKEVFAKEAEWGAAEAKDKERIGQELDCAKSRLDLFVRYWSHIAFCWANFMKFMMQFSGHTGVEQGASLLPLSSFHLIDLRADKAAESAKRLNDTVFALCGDALVTGDARTGLGANSAIQTAAAFEQLTQGMQKNTSLDELLSVYRASSQLAIDRIHCMSRIMRNIYPPNTVCP